MSEMNEVTTLVKAAPRIRPMATSRMLSCRAKSRKALRKDVARRWQGRVSGAERIGEMGTDVNFLSAVEESFLGAVKIRHCREEGGCL